MSGHIVYWQATYEVEADGFGRMRSGAIGLFDSEEKAKAACQASAVRENPKCSELQWHVPPWDERTQADFRDEYPCLDARIFFVDRVALVIL